MAHADLATTQLSMHYVPGRFGDRQPVSTDESTDEKADGRRKTRRFSRRF